MVQALFKSGFEPAFDPGVEVASQTPTADSPQAPGSLRVTADELVSSPCSACTFPGFSPSPPPCSLPLLPRDSEA
uniref:Uncharacterized protein n=1 Tax=Knipowitschia caucasica TaxID=637954 RepID=A0AAV2JCY4_KNICA